MARSMTGYGSSRVSDDGLSVAVELRSVNNRFLDLNLKLPRLLYAYESDIRELFRNHLQRGRLSVHVAEEWSNEENPEIQVDVGKAQKYTSMLQNLQKNVGLKGEVTLDHLLTFSDLFGQRDDELYQNRLWTLTKKAIEDARDQLIAVSIREGKNLAADLHDRIKAINYDLGCIEEWAVQQVNQYRQKLTQRLEELVQDSRLDPGRIEMEIAIIADRLDISEEIVRLKSHIELFDKTLDLQEPIGKTLGFLLQEMGREVNTISSKSWMVEISQTAVRVKEVIEQIREQVQNIE